MRKDGQSQLKIESTLFTIEKVLESLASYPATSRKEEMFSAYRNCVLAVQNIMTKARSSNHSRLTMRLKPDLTGQSIIRTNKRLIDLPGRKS